MSEKSLQINIDSIEDAKSVIRNLPKIKIAYEAHACTSIELCIYEEVVTPTAKILVGAFPWCVHYRRIMKPQDGNVLFQLPHLTNKEVPVTARNTMQKSVADKASATAKLKPRQSPPDGVKVITPSPAGRAGINPGKTAALVQPPSGQA